jgi:predicted MFS family arabinose efflux permease
MSRDAAPSEGSGAARLERRVVLLVALVQFVNILDFMIVMPLGAYFADALGFPRSHVGYVGGSYTLAAFASGLAGVFFLDRHDRKRALLVSLGGLTVATALGGAARDFPTLLGARVLAGLFGGPATSVALALVADVVPPVRRGAALGVVMTAFSVASVVGVPVGLSLADAGGWRTPFFGTAALGAAALACVAALLPPMRSHLLVGATSAAALGARLRVLLLRPAALMTYGTAWSAMMGAFVLIPVIAPYLDANLGYPKPMLKLLYLAGGVVSFVTVRWVGRVVDRFGSTRVAAVGTALLGATTYLGFVWYSPAHTRALVAWAEGTPLAAAVSAGGASLPAIAVAPFMALFVGYMFSSSFRNVATQALASKVPGPEERAAFMSVLSAVQHAAATAGAFLSSSLLADGPGGSLAGMPTVAAVSIGLAALVPPLVWRVERAVAGRPAPAGAPAAAPAPAGGGD